MKDGTRTLAELCAAVPGARLPDRAGRVRVREVTGDSRAVRPGAVFVCLKGARRDGHAFVQQAVMNGAVAVVAEYPLRSTRPVVVTPDTRRALALLAAGAEGWPSRDLAVVGITGTNGKTTTAWMLESILEAAGRRPGLFGTIGCRFGRRALPGGFTTAEAPSLQRMFGAVLRGGGRSVAMEVSSHALDQRRVDGTRFTVGVFTNLTRDHLDYHGSMAAYFEAKARLFESLPSAADGGVAVLNIASAAGRRLSRRTAARVMGYAVNSGVPRPGTGFTASRVRASLRSTRFVLEDGVRRLPVRLKLLGSYNVENGLAAACAARGLGLPDSAIRLGLERLACVPGRFERVGLRGAPFTLVVDYAHTPDALTRVLEAGRRLGPRRLLAVFGCGGNRDRGKRPKMGAIATRLADRVWITSDNPRYEDPDAIIRDILAGIRRPGAHAVEPDRRRAIALALAAAGPGDLVIVAGKGHEREQIIGDRRFLFDDAGVARAAWAGVRA